VSKTSGVSHNVSVDNESLQKLIKHFGDVYQEDMERVLLGIFHRFVNDSLTVSDLLEIGERYSIDLEKIYLERVLQETYEDEDE
jgi:hypothetical protein